MIGAKNELKVILPALSLKSLVDALGYDPYASNSQNTGAAPRSIILVTVFVRHPPKRGEGI